MGVARSEARRIRITGTVQGVGFRPWVYRVARAAGVVGTVRNDPGGVTIDAVADADALNQFVDGLQTPPSAARILTFEQRNISPFAATSFEIVESSKDGQRTVSIPPDLATCPDCLAEIFDPQNPRYRYPFTNCTNCGPRFTIATNIPYDRQSTTMTAFSMCSACEREYHDPRDRRFHAQPNACPDCGPRVTLQLPGGARLYSDDPIAVAARAIRDGLIVAVKGIGGFHLVCDATSNDAVRRLRARKQRDEKPLALMVRDVDAAASLAHVGPVERELLTSVERPIVLMPKRASPKLATLVAPGNQMLGLFLPYSPLHHLLLAAVRRPVVMTSANPSDEPICCDNEEALVRLGAIADLFVMHDRPIETRCDDSVVTVVGGRGTVVRRSRGYVPRPIALTHPVVHPVLACGALLKNTFCFAYGTSAWLGPHIGDLENLTAYEAYQHAIERMERFLRIQPTVIAHDLHPDYMSTVYAKQRGESRKVAVQHHHAHVVSAMVEHGLDGPVLGIAYDGTGFGTDGTLWGGELLVTTARTFQRAATFRPIRLLGGDQAIREPWRIALALALDAFDGEVPDAVRALIADVPARTIANVIALLKQGTAVANARGVGRYFDGFAALFLGRNRATFEGQLALEWNQAADPAVTRGYRFAIEPAEACDEIDLRPAFVDALADFERGAGAPSIAAAFHNTIAAATTAAVKTALGRHGRLPIVASGGCFQNARLAESIRAALTPEFDVFLHEQVPPGDGGIALGQAVIASAFSKD